MRTSLLPILLTCMAGSAALADEHRAVPSGVNRQIDFFASVNPDCSSAGLPTIRLVDGPISGLVTTDRGRDFMAFAKGNVRHTCNTRRVTGVKLFYKSRPDFFGTDHVRILILSAAGTGREATYDIEVR